jgi:hypothetical protein
MKLNEMKLAQPALSVAPGSGLDVADCCVTLEEAQDAIRRIEDGVRRLLDGLDAGEWTDYGIPGRHFTPDDKTRELMRAMRTRVGYGPTEKAQTPERKHP